MFPIQAAGYNSAAIKNPKYSCPIPPNIISVSLNNQRTLLGKLWLASLKEVSPCTDAQNIAVCFLQQEVDP